MQFEVLGPLRVRCGAGEPLQLVGHRRRTILAVLLLSPNRVVDLDELIDAVWDDRPPASTKRQIQNCVSALRRELGSGAAEPAIAADGLGYLVRVDDEQLDALAFQKLAAQGDAWAASGDARQAVSAFRAALALWRGRALSGLTARAVQAGAARLNEERLATLERCVELELGLGRHHQLVSELAEAVADQPLRERLVGLLMTALRRSGRQADALREYQRLQVRLAEDLGVDPCTELQQLYLAILRNAGEPADAGQVPVPGPVRGAPGHPASPAAGRAGSGTERRPTGRPAAGADGRPPGRARPERRQCNQLPRDVADFTGRRRPVGELVASLTAAVPGGTVTAISGMPGVGKTALAVHVGHRLRGEFPDGQLFVNLGGIGATPVPADDALLRILLLLGLRRTKIPRQADGRTDLYRAQLATRRLLIVLDDAVDEAQVRPLLPAGAGSAVLITSRRPLAGLEAAHRLPLPELDLEEAVELLARVAGAERVAGEPAAARRIVQLCGQLPLAIRIAGAKLAVRPHWALSELAERLTGEQRRLDELQVGDLAVRASFSLSYQALDPASQQVFATLGMVGAGDFPAWVPATLVGRPVAEVQEVLERLVDSQLLDVARRDPAGRHRYRVHDLLTVFARERLRHSGESVQRQAGLGRAVGGWLAVVDSMEARLVNGDGPPADRDPGGPAAAYPLGWLPAQRAALPAAAAESPAALWELGWAVTATLVAMSFELWSHWDDWQMTREVACIAGHRVGDRLAPVGTTGELRVVPGRTDPWTDVVVDLEASQAVLAELGEWRWHAATVLGLGNLYRAQARFDLAASTLRRSVQLARELGHPEWDAAAQLSLGSLYVVTGLLPQAVARYRRCLAIFAKRGDEVWRAHVQRALGYAYQQHGRFAEAVATLRRCLPVLREQDDCMWEAHTLLTLARAELGQGHHQDAAAHATASVAMFKRQGDRRSRAMAFRVLAAAARGSGDDATALASLDTSLRLFREQDDPVGVAHTLYDLATLHRGLSRADDAAGYYRSCRRLFHELGLTGWEARTLEVLRG